MGWGRDSAKARLELSTREEKVRARVKPHQVHYGEGLILLEFSTKGSEKVRFKPCLSLGRAIIIRNGEIIPMSREFTPETERQRLQLLVSRGQVYSYIFPYQKASYWDCPGMWAVECWVMQQEEVCAAIVGPAEEGSRARGGGWEQQRLQQGRYLRASSCGFSVCIACD